MLCSCSTCGKQVNRTPWQIKRAKNHFCGTACQREFAKKDVVVTCSVCGKTKTVRGARTKEARRTTCSSDECRRIIISLTLNKNAKGERLSTQGYMFIRLPEHHLADSNGYVKRANLVMEEKLGRKLEKGEVVHHIDRDKLNDNPDNLYLFPSNSEHVLFHYIYDETKIKGR